MGLVLLFASACLLRLGYCAASGGLGQRRPGSEYALTAARLLRCGTLTSPLILADSDTSPSALMPPVYVGMVAAVFAIWGVDTTNAILVLQLLNAAACAGCVVGVFKIAEHLSGRPAAWMAAAIALVNPCLFGFTDLIWDTCFYALGVVVTAWMTVALGRKPFRPGLWFAFGLWLGALALLNPSLTIVYPLLVLWPLTRVYGWRLPPVAWRVMLVLCGWGLAILPWTMRNFVQFRELIYIRNGFPLELWLGVCPEADPGGARVYLSQFPMNQEDAQREVSSLGERVYLKECRRKAIAAIRQDPWRYVRLVAMRAVDYWGGTVMSHSVGGAGPPISNGRFLVMVFLLVESFFVCLALVLARHLGPDAWWLVAILMGFSLIYCVTHTAVRFRTPAEPLVAVLIAVLLSHLLFVEEDCAD